MENAEPPSTAVENYPNVETAWNEGFSAGLRAAKEGPPGYRERLRAANTFKIVELAKDMHDALLEVSTGRAVDDATLIGSLTVGLGSFLAGSLCPTQRDEWVQQFIAGLPSFVAMGSEDGGNALRREKGDYGHLRLVKRPEPEQMGLSEGASGSAGENPQ